MVFTVRKFITVAMEGGNANAPPALIPLESETGPQPTRNPAKNRPFLPFDITWSVTEHLSGDHHTLRGLALVSWLWYPSSRYHLFRSYQLRTYHDDCAQRLRRVKEMDGRLARFVRELTLGWGWSMAAGEVHPKLWELASCWAKREPRVELGLLFSALQQLPSLHTLVLRSCILRRVESTDAPPSLSPGLQKLVLADVRGTLAAFNDLLGNLPVGRTLHMLDCSILDEPNSSRIPLFHSKLAKLSELVVELKQEVSHHDITRLFYTALLSVPNGLTTLDIGPLFINGGLLREGAIDLIRERGQAITQLRLDLCREVTQRMAATPDHFFQQDEPNLSKCCPLLEVLHITLYTVCSTPNPLEERKSVVQSGDASLLISTAPSTLRKVIIGVRSRTTCKQLEATSEDVGLSKMDTILGRFKQLDLVQLQGAIPFPILPPMAERPMALALHLRDFFSASFPITHSRGLLRLY